MFGRLFRREPVWMELIPRLVDAELLPDNPALIDSILALGKPRVFNRQEYRDHR